MVLGTEQCSRLVAWTALVLFELYTLNKSKRRQYDNDMGSLRMSAFHIPSWVFGWIWMLNKSLIVASMFFWAEYAVLETDWTFPTAFSLVFALVVFSKFWTVLFFDHCAYGASLVLSLFLAALSIAAVTVMGLSSNEGVLWAVPFALFVPVTAWYFFAAVLTFEWCRLKCGWYQQQQPCNDEESVYIVTTREGSVPLKKQSHPHSQQHHGHHHGHGNKQRFDHPHHAHHHNLQKQPLIEEIE